MRLIDADVLLQKISRMLDYCQDNGFETEMSALFQVGDAIIDCPTINPESLRPQWKSPLEGYPRKNEIILIHDVKGDIYVGANINTPVERVAYWMPLPEPPKGE